MTPTAQTIQTTTRDHRPAQGLLRLTWPQVEEIRRLYSLLCAFLAENGQAEARLSIIVKRGKVRFAELELPAEGDIPPRGIGQMAWERIQQIDVKLSSLCAFTQDSGEARLILAIEPGGRIEMRMALSQELGPGR
jgi:hypothetical protein